MSEDNLDNDFENEEELKKFICPECGSSEPGEEFFLSKEPLNTKAKDPWANVLQQIECSKCKSIIPLHLAERWDGINYEEAKEEWLKIYKKNNKKQKYF